MTPEERKARERWRRRTAVLEKAQELIFQKGFDGTTIEDIAVASGYTKRSIYLYFKDREEIFFAVTARGDVFSGPLFLMERMEAGFSPETNDWRYSMIMPDGSIFGITKGAGSERVEFCHTCHEAVGDTDNLFFVPEDNRVRFLNQSSLD